MGYRLGWPSRENLRKILFFLPFEIRRRLLSGALIGSLILFIGLLLSIVPDAPPFLAALAQNVGVITLSVILGAFLSGLLYTNPFLKDVAEFERGRYATRVGLTKMYVKREQAVEDVLEDLATASKCCRMYAAVCVSEIHKRSELPNLISEAAQRSRKNRDDTFCFSFTSLNPQGDPNDAVIRDWWAVRERDEDSESIAKRIEKAHKTFEDVVKDCAEGDAGGALKAKRRFFSGYPCLHSLIIIDDHIVHVGLYDWYNKRGNDAPAFRLEDGPWATLFISEANEIDKRFSVDAQIRIYDKMSR